MMGLIAVDWLVEFLFLALWTLTARNDELIGLKNSMVRHIPSHPLSQVVSPCTTKARPRCACCTLCDPILVV